MFIPVRDKKSGGREALVKMYVSEKIKNGIDLTFQESLTLAYGFLNEPGITYVAVWHSTGDGDLNSYQTVFYVGSVLYAQSYHSRHGEAVNFSQPYKVKKIQKEHRLIETLYVPVWETRLWPSEKST